MKTFKPFMLPSLGFHGPSFLISDTDELRELLIFQNQFYLKEYKALLPWYIKVKNCGRDIKIEVMTPEICVENI